MKKLVILTTLLASIIMLIMFFLFPFVPKNSDSLITNKSTAMIETPKGLTIKAVPQATETEIDEIDTDSSEYSGKWAGLCAKNSINSSTTKDPISSFQNVVMSDPVLVQHFGDFIWSRATITTLDTITEDNNVSVSHRSGVVIKPSKKSIKLKKNDEVITDGYRVVRTFCCNDVLIKPPTKITKTPPVVTYPPIYTHPTEPTPLIPITDVPYGPSTVYYYGGGGGGSHIEYIDKPQPSPQPAPVPEPATLVLFGTGLGLLTFLNRKRK